MRSKVIIILIIFTTALYSGELQKAFTSYTNVVNTKIRNDEDIIVMKNSIISNQSVEKLSLSLQLNQEKKKSKFKNYAIIGLSVSTVVLFILSLLR